MMLDQQIFHFVYNLVEELGIRLQFVNFKFELLYLSASLLACLHLLHNKYYNKSDSNHLSLL